MGQTLKTNEAGKTLCDGTHCLSLAVGSLREAKEIPLWRHPSDLLRQRMFEELITVNYCEDHKEAAYRTAWTPIEFSLRRPID